MLPGKRPCCSLQKQSSWLTGAVAYRDLCQLTQLAAHLPACLIVPLWSCRSLATANTTAMGCK